MRTLRLALTALALLLILSACAPGASAARVLLIDGGTVQALEARARTPSALLESAGIALGPDDILLVNSFSAAPDSPLDCETCILQVRRAVPLTVIRPDGQQTFQTAAGSVAEALVDAGYTLYAADRFDPPASTPLTGPLTVTWLPARELTVRSAQGVRSIRSAAATVGQALAEAGLGLQHLDYSQPAADAPLPEDGQVRLVRVREELLLTQKTLPYTFETTLSAELEIDQQELLQAGDYGLAMGRVRVRYEDDAEVGRQTEAESVIRPARAQILGYGTRIVIRSAVVNGVAIEYWRAVQMYATSYSPCRSAGIPGVCYTGTASGKRVQQGVVAVVRRWWNVLVGQPVFVPGYGYATIEDIGGGLPGKYWIDLGYSDDDFIPWSEWVTVYFLTPVPADPLIVLP